jgi:hypothetical protein
MLLIWRAELWVQSGEVTSYLRLYSLHILLNIANFYNLQTTIGLGWTSKTKLPQLLRTPWFKLSLAHPEPLPSNLSGGKAIFSESTHSSFWSAGLKLAELCFLGAVMVPTLGCGRRLERTKDDVPGSLKLVLGTHVQPSALSCMTMGLDTKLYDGDHTISSLWWWCPNATRAFRS